MNHIRLTTAQKVDCVKTFYRNNAHVTAAAEVSERHGRPILRQTVARLVAKFETTGSVDDLKPPGRPRTQRTDAQMAALLKRVENSPRKSIRRHANDTG